MALATRALRTTEIAVGSLFALIGSVLLLRAVMYAGGAPCWGIGTGLVLLSGLAAVPEWRDSFGSSLGRVRVSLPGVKVSTGGGPALAVAQPAAPETDAPAPRAPVHAEVADAGRTILKALETIEDARDLWSVAVNLIHAEDYGTARAVLDAALERYPDDPRLLISAGYLWSRLKEQPRAIAAARRAVAGARGRDDLREQLFLASANLCYYLAQRGDRRDRQESLAAGEMAAAHVDEFPQRSSFAINYGYAQAVFGTTREELARAMTFLVGLHARDLSAAERVEVGRHLQLCLGKLLALDGVAEE